METIMDDELLQTKVLLFCKELQKEAVEANEITWGLSDCKKDLYTYFVYAVYRLRIITAEECKEFIKDIDIHTYNVICEAEKWKKEYMQNAATSQREKEEQ